MSKKLKVSFAMGGGVTLGSFSGASLTEILKLLILFGRDEDGNRYDEIVLDSFSGASAGAISLAIMVRALIDYKNILSKLQEEIPDLSEDSIKARLVKEYGAKVIQELSQKQLTQLIAAEVCQLLQEVIWVKNISVEALFGVEKPNKKKSTTSLLERDYLNDSSAKYLLHGIDQLEKDPGTFQSKLQLLAKDRILFACSLSNLSSISRTKQYSKDPIIKSFQRSFNDYDHKELRVLDFQFQKGLKSAPRWLSLGLGTGYDYNINSAQAWSMFASSAIACGAFPIAFTPAVLVRKKKELDLPEEVAAIEGDTLKFAYVDGGTFNNEPISEAFKLANYLDFNDPQPKSSYERIVFFVDPIVSKQDLSYNIDFLLHDHAKYRKEKKDFRLKSIRKRKVSSNLSAYATKLIGVLRREGVVKEGLKIRNYMESYQQLQMLEDAYQDSTFDLQGNSLRALLYVLIKYTEGKIKNLPIPPGTHDPIYFLEHKYRLILQQKFGVKLTVQECDDFRDLLRQVNEKPIVDEEVAEDIGLEGMIKNVAQAAPHQAYRSYKKIVKKMMESGEKMKARSDKMMESVTDFFEKKDKGTRSATNGADLISNSKDRKKALSFLLLDLLMETYDKDSNAYLVAITPIDFYRTDKEYKQHETMDLPGGEFEAFAGAASEASRKIAFKQGRLCSLAILEQGAFRRERLDTNDTNNDEKEVPIIDAAQVATYKQMLLNDIKENFSDSKNYLGKYQDALVQKLKVIGANRIYYILLKVLPLNSIYTFFIGLGGLLTFIPNAFLGFRRSMLSFLMNINFVNKGFRKAIKFRSGNEVMIQIQHPSINKKRCKVYLKNDDNTLVKLKLRVVPEEQSIYFLLPYIEEKEMLYFYTSKYRKRKIDSLEFNKNQVINNLKITQRGRASLDVDLSHFLIKKTDQNRLKYFINPHMKITWNDHNEKCHSTVMDAAIPLEEQILALFKAKAKAKDASKPIA